MKNLNRATRKGGKKVSSPQSLNALKKEQSKPRTADASATAVFNIVEFESGIQRVSATIELLTSHLLEEYSESLSLASPDYNPRDARKVTGMMIIIEDAQKALDNCFNSTVALAKSTR